MKIKTVSRIVKNKKKIYAISKMERLVEKTGRRRVSILSPERINLACPNLGGGRLYRWGMILFICFSALLVKAQRHLFVPFQNASFEGKPTPSKIPEGWFHCGPFDQSPPDLQPSFFGQQPDPEQGRTYVGLVARKDGTKESIGQHLPYELEAGQCYQLKVSMLRSDDYQSATQANPDEKTSFIAPLKMKLYGGQYYCDDWELLATSPLVTNDQWKTYAFYFSCQKNTPSLIFEVAYDLATSPPYNGNIMIDDCRPIVAVDCETKLPIIEVDSLESPIIIEDLGDYLKKYGAALHQKNSLFVDEAGDFLYENKTAYEILNALKKDASKQLVIWVNPKMEEQKRFKTLVQMNHRFYHHPQVKITTQKRKTKRVKWMYSDEVIRVGLRE